MRMIRSTPLVAAVVAAASMTLAAAPDQTRAAAAAGPRAARTAPRFYDDEAIAHVVDTQDASKAAPHGISLIYDAVINLFGRPGLQDVGRAESVNTIDEVPNSESYTNRVGTRAMTCPPRCCGVRVTTPDPRPGN